MLLDEGHAGNAAMEEEGHGTVGPLEAVLLLDLIAAEEAHDTSAEFTAEITCNVVEEGVHDAALKRKRPV